MSKVLIIGGGAAGMMAAVAAGENGHEVWLYEKNDRLGKKIIHHREGALQYYKCRGHGNPVCFRDEQSKVFIQQFLHLYK
ncbi:hypothetical protein HMPREF0991_01512 [Lachnospiraceae bacterium 2_1_58FAA]|uniref:FAD-dependent oxidoreductase n=1 Tax=Mediterraneibacter gnavus TaxID=33038 RepID=UPI0002135B86|nr:hypothetical protein HMPREF0991_01512 [Lachnospiraceae bacterium 2_1_58FAA]